VAKFDRQQLSALSGLVEKASKGELPELHKALLLAGYTLGHIARTRDDAGRFFGVAARNFSHWCALEDFPETDRKGGYDLSKITRWRIKYVQGLNGGPKPSPHDTLATIKAAREKLKLQRDEAKLVELAEVEAVLGRYITEARTILRGLPATISMLLPEELRVALRPVVERQIDQTCDILERIALDLAEGREPQADSAVA